MAQTTGDTDDSALTFEFKNVAPVELTEFTLSMLSLSNEFKGFVAKNDPSAQEAKVKLYINQIRPGSIVADLYAHADHALPALLPFLNSGKTVFDFASHLKTIIEWLLHKGTKAPNIVEKNTLENVSQILDPVCKDHGSQLVVSMPGTVHGDFHFHLSSLEANAAQNQIRHEIQKLQEPFTGDRTQVAMSLYQARNDPSGTAGDRVVIESVFKGPVKAKVAGEKLKYKYCIQATVTPLNMPTSSTSASKQLPGHRFSTRLFGYTT